MQLFNYLTAENAMQLGLFLSLVWFVFAALTGAIKVLATYTYNRYVLLPTLQRMQDAGTTKSDKNKPYTFN